MTWPRHWKRSRPSAPPTSRGGEHEHRDNALESSVTPTTYRRPRRASHRTHADVRRNKSRNRRDVGEPAAPGKLADRRNVRRTGLGRSNLAQGAIAGVDHHRD